MNNNETYHNPAAHNSDEKDFEFNDEIDNLSAQTNLLARLLRIIGAGMIFLCASIFLFQRWGGGNDIQRYLFLLGFTAVLTAGGFFCGLKLQESKGARTLLGLTLAVTPVNFAVIGGLVYSQFSFWGVGAAMPGFATWIAPSPGAALAIAVGGSLALAPLCYISFLTMGRERAKALTACFFLGNLALLLPTRLPDPIGLMIVGSVIAMLYGELRYFNKESSLRTVEGRFARAILWVPSFILIGRTGYFYYPSELFAGCILAAAAMVGFTMLPKLTEQWNLKIIFQVISSMSAIASWVCFADVILRAMNLSAHWTIPLCTIPSAVILLALSAFAIGGGAGYRRSAAIIALAGVTANLYFYPGLLASFVCLVASIVILIYGYSVEQKVIFLSGLVGIVIGLGYHLKYALSFYSLTNWGSLAITGIATIVIASVIERNPNQIKERAQAFRKRIQGWGH